jgi:hypothetical protein
MNIWGQRLRRLCVNVGSTQRNAEAESSTARNFLAAVYLAARVIWLN